MPEPSPEIVAAASLSPVSPVPVPIQNAIQHSAIPRLQDQAATTAPDLPPTTSPVPQRPPTMDPAPQPTGDSDTIVVGGDYSDESHEESDHSIDYGAGEEGQQQGGAEQDAANDDYARTFDSPGANEHHSEAEEAQPDVPMASESMHSPSAPVPLTSPSQAAAAPPPHRLSPTPPPALPQTNGSAPSSDTPAESEPPMSTESGSEPPSTAPNAGSSSTAQDPNATPTAASEEQAPAASSPNATLPAAPATAPDLSNDSGAAVDIQKLVDNITARAAATASPPHEPAQALPNPTTSTTSSTTTPTTQAAPTPLTLSHPPSLPPKPSLPNPPANLPALSQFHPRGGPHAPAAPGRITSPGASHGSYGASEGISSLPPPPPAAYGGPSHPHPSQMPQSADGASVNYHAMSVKQRWELFQSDEKRYTSEAKWERFPEGSRIFIGNLSSERVSKREVFDVFSRFGRLAQISLKNAYGFVQYHTIAEGHAAMQGVQGIELGGRRIHLEISRAQKRKDDRDRSPDRRAERDGRRNGRHESVDHGFRRDDYRPGRSPSPRRNDPRGPYSRDREFGGPHGRRRSRSPPRYSRYGDDSYRRRSPSPHRRTPSESERFDLPRRFGADVPDVQIVLLQEVSQDFVSWVQGAFHAKGLKTDVMYLNPRFPRDTIVQRQVVEGVHAIVDLDYTAQTHGKIPIQVFIRSGGSSVRFELYQGIDPPVAADLVVREKSQASAAAAAAHSAPSRPAYGGYGAPQQSYQTEPTPPAGYPYAYPPPHHQQQQHAAHAQPTQHQPPPHQAAAAAPPSTAADLASVVGQLDNTALQALLASLQTPQAAAGPQHQQQQYHQHQQHQQQQYQQPAPAAATAPQIDMNALLGNLRSAAAVQPPYGVGSAAATPAAVAAYGAAPAVGGGGGGMVNGYGGGAGGADTAAQVQTIIEQLKRAAQ